MGVNDCAFQVLADARRWMTTDAEILALAAAISRILDRQQWAMERVEDLKFRRRPVKHEEPQEAVDDVSEE